MIKANTKEEEVCNTGLSMKDKIRRAMALVKASKYEDAIVEFKLIIEEYPDINELYPTLCDLYLLVGRADIPAYWIKKAIQYNSSFQESFIEFSDKLFSEGRFEDSRNILSALVESNPDSKETLANLQRINEIAGAEPNKPINVAAGNKWGIFHHKRQAKEDSSHNVLWMDSPVVREYVRQTYLDSHDFFSYVKSKYVPQGGFRRGLELGCGSGFPTLAFASIVKSIDAFDCSEAGIELAKENAAQKGIHNIRFEVADVNKITLPYEEYDVVFFHHSLHHFEALERIFSEVNKALKPGGMIIIDDYMGPDRMQWGQREYAIMNAIDSILPDKYRRDSIHGYQVRPKVEIIPLQAFEPDWPGGDPSEAVRSEDIIPELKKVFEIIEERPKGGSLLHGLLQGIVHNFNPDDEHDTAILRLICLIEELMIKEAGLKSYFKAIVARKKRN